MKNIKAIFRSIKDFFVKYPAVLSGYIIYSYLFIGTMDFYLDVEKKAFTLLDYIQNFDALLWMWLLAFTLVKIIEYRSKLMERENKQLLQEREIVLKETRLRTVHEVVRTLQHDINNPLAIIMVYSKRAERFSGNSEEVNNFIKEIKVAGERIQRALQELSKLKAYETEETPVGTIAKHEQRDDNT